MLEKIEKILNLVTEIHHRQQDELKEKFIWRRELLKNGIPFLGTDEQIKEAIDAGRLTPLQQRNQVYLRAEVYDYIEYKLKEIGLENYGISGADNEADPKRSRKSLAGDKKKGILSTLEGF